MTARDRAKLSNLARRQDTREALELRRLNQRAPTYGGDGYRVRTLGAAGSIPGRTRSKTSRGSVGEPLDLLGGGLGSRIDSASDQELRDILRDMQQMIQAISNRRGILLYQGDETTNPNDDPNDAANDGEGRAFQRYDNQLVYTGSRDRIGALYCHLPAITTDGEEQPEVFVPVQAQEDLTGYIEAPTAGFAYPLVAYAEYKTKITSLYAKVGSILVGRIAIQGSGDLVIGDVTITINKAIGSLLDVGEELTLSSSDTSGNDLRFTVGMLRI